MSYALEAIRVVKHEGDNNKLELLTDECMTNFLSNPDNYLIIAIDDNIVAGFVVAYELQRVDRNQKLMFLYEIGVLKTHRKKGIGTVLMNLEKSNHKYLCMASIIFLYYMK
jgi:ribosomal protein S18 acetylase RimI-like enzyme